VVWLVVRNRRRRGDDPAAREAEPERA